MEKHIPVSGYDYDGPSKIDTLQCQKCKISLGKMKKKGQKLKIKQAPSQNLGDVLEMWQCHEESYDRLINEKTGEVKIPEDVFLFNISCLELKHFNFGEQGPSPVENENAILTKGIELNLDKSTLQCLNC